MQHKKFPIYQIVDTAPEGKTIYHILNASEAQTVPEEHRNDFNKDGQVTVNANGSKTIFLTPVKASKVTISENIHIEVSKTAADLTDYIGSLSDFISSAYKFSRKSKPTSLPVITLNKDIPKVKKIIKLAEVRIRTKEWANGRGDIQGTPKYFQDIAADLAKNHNLKLTIFKGKQLLEQGFRLHHAVGRSSVNEPSFVNLAYNGNPDSDEWVAFVGKGVCFDTGGYNIKTTAGMKDMFLDKHGACSVLSAFQGVVEEKLKINLTVSIGLVQNFIGENAYRPSDIITSRKGLTVEIGNTDAEGRLVLADAMHWTQQNYKVNTLIELSTLTGAIIIALGSSYAGLFTNDHGVYKKLKHAGQAVHEQVWRMPVNQDHKKTVTPKVADLTNSAGSTAASSSQAAAFLSHFVEEGVKWVHLDIAGTAIVGGQGSGYGARLLYQYAISSSKSV